MDKIIISHVGLMEKDLVLLRNLSHLDETWFGNFQLASEPGTMEGQILLVDVDKPESRSLWQRMKAATHFEKTIVISRSKQPVDDGAIHLTRPLIFRRLREALQQATQSDQQEAKTHVKNILVVDDNLPVRTFMKQKLHEILDFEAGVDVAESGEEALLKVRDCRYDLVFMDVMMPGMDGYQACRSIKQQVKTKVVMLTSKSSTLNRVKAKMSGCDGYITKPPEDRELAEVVRRYLGATKTETLIFPQLAALGR
ncbi:Response regulator consisting of a CheY-like receiver domain and a winged-helix DNA-binding domain [Hahella chejuensis KCTC 2396]|uniref:Response regulator consisting of a CheY-like receiver domain and a winged-helix DNA-binding domain n=1 Tax=Hahella chejuensis (strain KCTC 2396) TaxID=349521 RepID=Q2SA47_HAHCH|nr:response regulator [Hahella chejuensis]ABC32477.1 Response regulator consisting of a CheY-like receiver domain and a winged-helix DNA-binding domain [Hahella chejuensis KCTC 2396]